MHAKENAHPDPRMDKCMSIRYHVVKSSCVIKHTRHSGHVGLSMQPLNPRLEDGARGVYIRMEELSAVGVYDFQYKTFFNKDRSDLHECPTPVT